MNHIERLIEEMCPDGVPFKPLGEIATLVRGSGLPKSKFTETGTGCIHYGQIYTRYGTHTDITYSFTESSYAKTLTQVNPGDLVITNTSENIEDVCKAVAWLGEETIVTGGHATVIKHDLDPKFLSYYTQCPAFQAQKNKLAQGTKVIEVSANNLAKIAVPIPPLAVQHEIVEILDKFSRLEAELEADLEAELEARNTQLNAVRESLFTNLEDYTTAPLSTITVESYSGMTPRATEKRYYDGGTIPWLRSQDINFNIIQNATSFITEKALRETSLQMIPSNCLIVAISGASAGRSATNAFPTTTNQHCCCLKIDASKADLRYVYHWLASNYLVLKNMGRGARGDLNHSIIKSLPIKLPPIEVQQSCARMLDNLSNLVSSHVDGLPAEITARRQQYEYYRDRLLTFKELQ
ncbi:restriction endonuclease subunit S [Buchananella felis]|uniref:restriction endonuclease subunit S n=1 Tax=Buchananella felis TaxID=3231492 RepID=UPI0035291674